MSQNLARLCALLIEDTYGPLYSHIFATLTSHGRLTARDLSQRCHLPIRHTIAGLATLAQCLLVFHHTAHDGRSSYQANPSAAFNLVRVGKFTQLMRHKFGRDGANLLNHLLIFGHDSLDNLQAVPAWVREHSRTNGLDPDIEDVVLEDGTEDDHSRLLRGLVKQLVEQDYLIELRPAHFQTWSDTWRAAEMLVKASGDLSNAKGKKGQEELEAKVRAEMGRRLYGDPTSSEEDTKNKRRNSDASELPPPKKQQRASGVSSRVLDAADVSSADKVGRIDGQTMLRFNHSKLLLVLQHQVMAHQVRRQSGLQPAKVLSALLCQCETTWRMVGEPPSTEGTQSEARYVRLNMDQLLRDVNAENHNHGDWRHTGLANGHINGNHGQAYDKFIDVVDLQDQIATLAEGCCEFIFRDQETGEWTVDVSDAETRLRDYELMQMIKRRFGPTCLRIIRILVDRGKVDEKALQEIGLLNAKDLRKCLAQLHAHGFVDLQEVPREPQRQPARTIYLWFYDAERVRKRVLENLYKSMCRLLQRLKVERQKVGPTLQKSERSDVKGREHEILRTDEIIVLKRWRRKELWYLGELERMSSTVDLLQTNA